MFGLLMIALLTGLVILLLRFEPLALQFNTVPEEAAQETPESLIAIAIKDALATDPILSRRPSALLDVSGIADKEAGYVSAVATIRLDSAAPKDFPVIWDSRTATLYWDRVVNTPESAETNRSDVANSPAGTSVAILTGDERLESQIPQIHIGPDGLLDVPSLGLREIATGRRMLPVKYQGAWMVAAHPAAMFAAFMDLSTRLVERGAVGVLFHPPVERITPALLDLEVDCFAEETLEPVRVICMAPELRERYFTRVIAAEGQPDDGSPKLGHDQLVFPIGKRGQLVTLGPSGELAVDGEAVSLVGLMASLRSFRSDIDGILLCFDEQLPYGRAHPIIEELLEIIGKNKNLSLWLSPSSSMQCRNRREKSNEKEVDRNSETTGERPATGQTGRIVKPGAVIAPSLKSSPRSVQSALNNCYPSASRRLNEEGRVVMVVTISIYGQMMHAHLAQSSGFSRLDEAAVCVLRQLTFNPGTQDGQPVESQATMPITFRLE